ncbi:MAG: ATP-dependent helicase HrpB [Pseudomonadota bacterium]
MTTLPITAVLEQIVDAVRAHGRCVVEAPPGAGKSTCVPAALLDAGLAGEGQVVVLQPRRLAARLLARYVAVCRGGEVGEEVGYSVRFDDRCGPGTRIVYTTEGTLLRRMISDPVLRGVGVLIVDEQHERSLDGDMVLALADRLRRGARPDLALVVMSATLDGERVAAWLDDAPRVRSEGRAFPVALEYMACRVDRPDPGTVAGAVRRVGAGEGDVLVFLPGAGEIRAVQERLEDWARDVGVDLRPLHGDLSLDAQAAAVRPGPRPKVILATNVAETSITVAGVTTVVDSGLVRVATWSPWSGLPALAVRRTSRASAAQRAGRAGRTAPGRCLRLYSEADLRTRDGHDAPEILRADLAGATLLLAGLGAGWDKLRWLDDPEPAALEAAHGLLVDLGALDAAGALSALGGEMLRLPLHPRAARVLVAARRSGLGRDGCLLAALLGEREVRRGQRGLELRPAESDGDSDLLDALERLRDLPDRTTDQDLWRRDLEPGAARNALRAAQQLLRILGRSEVDPPADPDAALRLALLTGYPDRVARRRRPGEAAVVMAGGGALEISPTSVVRRAELVIAVEAGERREPRGPGTRRVVWSASAVEPEWLLDLYPERLEEQVRVAWNAGAERLEVFSRLEYRDLVISEERLPRSRWPDVSGELFARLKKADPGKVMDREAMAALRVRVAFVAEAFPEAGWAPVTDADVDRALRDLCRDAAGFEEVRKADPVAAVRRALPADLGARLDALAPTRVMLPGRRNAPVSYPEDGRPYVASFLQDFFGLREAPMVAEGRRRLNVQLLAPNRRPVQITDDLAGFWERHYPTLRRQLMRRYPKHRWPEDPIRSRS